MNTNVYKMVLQIEDKNKKINRGAKISAPEVWRPQKAETYNLPPVVFPRLTVPNQKKMSKVLSFIEMCRFKRYNEGATIMPIPTTNKTLLGICGNSKEVSRLITFMKEIGLIAPYDETYHFGGENGRAKTYYYFYDNEKAVIEFCGQNNINAYEALNEVKEFLEDETIMIDSFDAKQVRFSSQLLLLKPDNYSTAQFENYLTACLYRNYPELAYYQRIADKLNKYRYKDTPELRLRFKPSFTWSSNLKTVRKIGIRCTNSLVSAKKEDNEDEVNFAGVYREEVLRHFNLNLAKDVKSSVPRITLSLNSGWWIPEDIDIYELIYREYVDERKRNGEYDEVGEFKDMREAIKSLHMRAYFDSAAMLGFHTRQAMGYVEDAEAVDREMRIFRNAVLRAEGGAFYDSEIFYHESCIYMNVLEELFKKGFFVWECYDAFYARKNGVSQEEFEKICRRIVERKANDYVKRWKSGDYLR